MEFNIRVGVHGFWVAGGTGESILLSDEEEPAALPKSPPTRTRGASPPLCTWAHPPPPAPPPWPNTRLGVGVEAICCVPPFFYGQSDESIVEHYRIVAAAADLPLLICTCPNPPTWRSAPPLMRKIQEYMPQLAAQHSAPYQGYVRDFANMGLACFVGNCRLMLPAMTIGAVGCVDGPPNMVPERWVALWNAYQSGDLTAAQAAQEHASKVADLVRPYKFHAIAKAVLSYRLGIDCGVPRPPMAALSAEEQRELMEGVRKLEIEPGG
ncbi:MAG: dihydrodipicolinate synthase family protein [Caldilineaceae bacterium]